MGTWHDATAALRAELQDLIGHERLQDLHRTSGWRHALVALRQVALLLGAGALVVRYPDRAWIWIPAAILLGFTIFSFTVLLHEVVHQAVFRRRASAVNGLLGWLYALPSGLSRTQFTRWHLDHHAELGSDTKDPKRHRLTPKIVTRWYKALYLTPALFPIYFRAAAKEAATYEPEIARRIRLERLVTVALHLCVMAFIAWRWGWPMLARLYVLPVFFVFPVAFTINRLGQHYDIRPDDPAAWGTILAPNPVWNFLFLWSGFHMEHHYFPGVPFYRLPALHRSLRPLFERHRMRLRSYGGLLWDWFVRNRTPHTSWE